MSIATSQVCDVKVVSSAIKTVRFTTASGRAGLELYLAEEFVSYAEGEPDKAETRTKGPIYAVDISTGPPARVLLFTAGDGTASREHLEILRVIVDTVQVAKIP
jgi:hypothetical protein